MIIEQELPHGMTYEWKRKTIYNLEDPGYQVLLANNGWYPVEASRHPEMMPIGARGSIEREGMVLMERPKEITDAVLARDKVTARDQVKIKEDQAGVAPSGTKSKGSAGFERRFWVPMTESFRPPA